ncbi:50S ribosomal protein L10 [Sulfuracidifex metallicus]|uniref:50S ribosomal protein L10 n=1 Tax=Sulfuracidifex metallicus TaxID=47303 RepID=UPI0030B8F23E
MIKMAVEIQQKKIAKWKIDEVEELTEDLKKNKTIIIGSLEGFPADKLHEIRKQLRGKAIVRVTKNSLFEIAAKNAGIDVSKLEKYLIGPNIFILTNDNPFTFSIFFEKFKLKRYAKAGDIAEEEVVIPAGDTGFSAGPVLSTFGKLKIKTRVQEGKIFVAEDTVIAKPGSKIPDDAIPILQKLGIMPVYIKLGLKGAHYEGLLIPSNELKIDLGQYASNIAKAYQESMAVAVEIAYPVPEVLKVTIGKAYRNAMALAGESGYLTPETAENVLSRAMAKAYALVSALEGKVDLGINIPKAQAPAAAEEKKEEKKEEENKGPSEEEIGGSISSLFG